MQTQKRDPRPGGEPEKAGGRGSPRTLENDPILDELRKLYDGIADEPLPDQLLDLLRKLDEVERKR